MIRERQCRDLWKLRATLHDDACVADNWTNYHQRLNRRYDSGYKSIENQLSNSLDGGNILEALVLPRVETPSQEETTDQHNQTKNSTRESDLLARPQSGCSSSLLEYTRPKYVKNNKQAAVNVGPQPTESKVLNDEETAGEEGLSKCVSTVQQTSPDRLDKKLKDLDLDVDCDCDSMTESTLDELLGRGGCVSQNSKSSSEEEVR